MADRHNAILRHAESTIRATILEPLQHGSIEAAEAVLIQLLEVRRLVRGDQGVPIPERWSRWLAAAYPDIPAGERTLARCIRWDVSESALSPAFRRFSSEALRDPAIGLDRLTQRRLRLC